MEEVNYLLESFKFMILGMTVVFAFLTLLIVVVQVQAKIIAKFFPENESEIPNTMSQTNNAEHVAAIIAAVTEFRKNK